MQKFTASPWTTWLSSWQYLSGINNLGWQLPWLSEGGGMLVQWYINTWVYKLFKSQFLIRPDISVTQLHTFISYWASFSVMHVLTHVQRLCRLPALLRNESFVLACSKVTDEACNFFLRELQIDCKFGLLLTSWTSEVFCPFFWRLSRMATPVKEIRRLTMKFIIVQCVSKTFFASMGWSPTWRHIQIIHWGKR